MTTYKKYITIDGYTYPSFFSKKYWIERFLKSEQYYIRTYIKYLRSEEYYTIVKPCKLLKYYYQRRKNMLGSRLGFFIHAGNFGAGLKLYHYGSVIVHPGAKIGRNCTLHGNCCIGSKGGFPDIPPQIGNSVDIGQGAQILGDITIADGVKIGAGTIVTKSVLEPGVTVVGIPARVINSKW
ncbi:serine O-acetyltransferase [Sphingobacterium sp. SGR-19]|uniref:serine O-acetyltransferase n=1 Tax=Sphingobacterium sp. SGR-19 TaxID=2710886 RepID=UPI0013EAF5E5|nr:serine acetyltransferase [Sphingobacterium sp. SGR-19]NGM64067.1 serine acetyltransferase [Sphingobacterium sp. SGR-19]